MLAGVIAGQLVPESKAALTESRVVHAVVALDEQQRAVISQLVADVACPAIDKAHALDSDTRCMLADVGRIEVALGDNDGAPEYLLKASARKLFALVPQKME